MGNEGNRRLTVGEADIPVLGCGTWELRGELCANIVTEALKIGYRHVDTAQGYDNEAAVGAGIRASGISRDEVFVTTKVRPQLVSQGALQRSVEESLERLQLDYVDLLLIHWPNPAIAISESMAALGDARRKGLTQTHRRFEFHDCHARRGDPGFARADRHQSDRIPSVSGPGQAARCDPRPWPCRHRILPIALGNVVGDPVIGAIARAHGKTEAQVTLRWLVQQGDVIAIPRTSKVERLRENLDVFNFELTAAEMSRMRGLTRPGSKFINQPGWVPAWD
jgi:diketogulonate reductase-like aldo/keto reductase